MCRELIYSLFIVLVLGLFGNALAEVNYELWYNESTPGFPDNGDPTWMPNYDMLGAPDYQGTAANFDIGVRVGLGHTPDENQHFAFRFRGYLGIRTGGDYDFWSESDDGSQLFIGPTLVVDNPGWHGSPGGNPQGNIALTVGFHPITVTMFEHEGGEALTVYYQGPGIDRQIIPAAALVRDPDFPASPYPADDARRVSINTVQAWAPGNSATSHKVYFGTWEPPTYKLTQAGTTFDPGTLEYLTDYYWQIVETDGVTDWAGPAWHFKTEPDPATITDVDLLAWYKFDGDYTDSSGYGNHGSPYGSAIGFVSDPERGQVAAFNGSDDCVDLGVDPYFNPAGSFSISVWANIEAWTATWGNVLVGKRGESGVSWQLRRFGGNPTLSFTTRGVGADNTQSNSTPAFGEWQHIAAVYDNAANTKHIYLDGIEDVVQTTNAGATVTPCAHNVYIGARANAANTGPEGFFLGMLDEVRIYSKALTPAEVEYLAIPLIASRPDPEDDSVTAPGIQITTDNLSMVLKYEPGKGAVSHTGYFSENYDDVLDRVAGANLGEPPYLEHDMNDYYVGYDDPDNIPAFACVSLERDKTYYWAVDEFDGATTYQGKVWSFTVMLVEAWGPDPFDGAKYVIADPDVTLNWNMGDVDTKENSVTYEVYYGTDEAAVETSTTPVVSVKDPICSYTIGPLPAGTDVYWRVDTKLALSDPPFTFQKRVKGTVWSFTTLPDMPITDPTLVGWWTFDRGYGTTVFDWSGHGNHGTLTGDPQWVAGQIGGALDFDGSGDFIYTGKNAAALGVSGNNPKTVTTWVYTRSFNAGGIFDLGTRGTDGQDFCLRTLVDNNWWRVQYWGGPDHDFEYTSLNEWVHFALVFDGSTGSTAYADGQVISSVNDAALDTSNDNPFQIGCYGWQNDYFDGLIDELRLYSRALSQAEIGHLMDPSKAWNPSPADGQMDTPLTSNLTWSAGTDPDTDTEYTRHDVYFGTDFDDVNSATVPTITLTDVNEFTPPALEYYERYYWRVNEVNAGGEVVTGDVWTFKAAYNPALVVDPNLLAWYKLDGDPNDSSGYGRDGAEMGGPTYVVGYDGQAIDFDGVDDYIDVLDSSPLNMSGSVTVACWIKVDVFDKTWQAIVTKGDNSWRLHRWGTGDGINWTHTGLTPLDIGGSTNVNDGGWHHIAGTYDHNTAQRALYVDGVLDASDTTTGSISSSNYNVNIGENAQATGRYWTGLIDDVRIYDKALAEAEILAVMRGNLAWAWSPKPGNGATGVPRNAVLSWTPGDYAPPTNGHYVYFGADDPDNLALVADQPQSPNNYSPGTLDLGRTYYWAVDEANTAAPGVDAGKIWSFTTIDHLVVDDMEEDYVIWGNPGLYACQVWVDGSGDCSAIPGNGTGSLLGLETTISYPDGFEHSIKVEYDNDGIAYNYCTQVDETRLTYSMVKAEVADLPSGIGSDWRAAGAKALSLQFQGSTGNAIEDMWVELTDSAIPTGKATVTYGDYADENKADIGEPNWHEWNIDLQDFADGGVDLTKVKTIAIGIGTVGGGAGGGGTVYFDEILLYAPRCLLSRRAADFALVDYAPAGSPVGDCVVDYQELEIMFGEWLLEAVSPPGGAGDIWRESESADILGASWRVYDDPSSSGAKHIGSENGDGDDNDTAPAAAWVATYNFNAVGGVYKILLRVRTDSDSFWVRIPSATSQTHEDPDQVGTGWVRFNGIQPGAEWHWDEVHSNDHDDAVVNWTLPAGAQTLEIAKREDGTWLDGILISDNLTLDPATIPPLVVTSDLSGDKKVNFKDYALVGEKWLDEDMFP